MLLRELLGEALRARRQEQGRTLREVSRDARVSLGYLSEVERGQKEASSELLAAMCAALDVELVDLLAGITGTIALARRAPAPTIIPAPVSAPVSVGTPVGPVSCAA